MKVVICTFFLITTSMLSIAQGDKGKTASNTRPVEIFSSQKVINANSTEVVPKGKMEFKVMHNFGDIAGSGGGLKNFFGLDNAQDIRIAFEIGIGDKTDVTFARAKGAGQQGRFYEINIKHQLLRQLENDPSHPISLALFVNAAVASNKASAFDNLDHSFRSFSDRLSETFQLIISRKMGKVSLQLNPTLVTRSYSISYDQKTIFALGGALKLPISQRVNFIVDYFHPFRSQSSRDSFRINNNIKFYDPLGVGFEIITGRHVFHLNFTNATETLENRFIPRTVSSWGKGQFRWGFTISRQFTLWKPKQ
ncbi:MAG TPA: DUF5777 family beta-barrel protein [Chitinophagaceae bacterium]|nr:DUF5777 family beta-barrel protein [Chitinophagaceae bacterium]